MKTCLCCKREKTLDEFPTFKKRGVHTVSCYCHSCVSDKRKATYQKHRESRLERMRVYNQKNRDKLSETRKQYYHDNKHKFDAYRIANKEAIADRTWAYGLQRRYGVTREQYQQMLDAQNGECAICGTPTPASHTDKFSVDHCHTTGKVRGLLCNRCNTSIGGLGDDPNVLLAAATYVARHNQENGVANKPLQSPQRSRAEDYLVKTRPQPVMPRIDPKNITVFNVHQMDLLHQLYIERVSKPIEDEYNRCQREIARLKKDLAVAQRRKLDWKIFQLSCQLEEFEFYAHAPTHWHKVELEFLEEIQSKLDTVKYQLKSLIDDTSSDTLSIVKAISREQAMQLLPALQQLIDTGEHP